MAIRDTNTTAGSLSRNDRLPRNRYTVQCIDEEFVTSKSSGNPMLVRVWEIISPESVEINGQARIIAGIEMKQYLPTICTNQDGSRDDVKSDKALVRIRDENENLGIPSPQIDDENPELKCKGVVADAILSAEEYSPRLDPTPEEIKKGMKQGQPIKGEDGKEIKNYRVKLDQILGLSSVKGANVAF